MTSFATPPAELPPALAEARQRANQAVDALESRLVVFEQACRELDEGIAGAPRAHRFEEPDFDGLLLGWESVRASKAAIMAALEVAADAVDAFRDQVAEIGGTTDTITNFSGDFAVDAAVVRDYLEGVDAGLDERRARRRETRRDWQIAVDELDRAVLSDDGGEARRLLVAVEANLQAWRLDEAATTCRKASELTADTIRARDEAARDLRAMQDRVRGWHSRAHAAGVPWPELDGDGKTTPELIALTAVGTAWLTALPVAIEDAEARLAAAAEPLVSGPPTTTEKGAAELSIERDEPATVSAAATVPRPVLRGDLVLEALARGRRPDPGDALLAPAEVAPIAYLERIRGLATIHDRESLDTWFEAMDPAIAAEHGAIASWLWSQAEPARLPLAAATLRLVVVLAEALATTPGEAPAGLLLLRTLNPDVSSDALLDAFYLNHVDQARSRWLALPALARHLEKDELPPPTTARAWLVALGLVLLARAGGGDDVRRQAGQYLRVLPKDPPELSALLQRALDERGAKAGTIEATDDRGSASSEDQASELREEIKKRTNNPDLWKRHELREVERDFVVEVELVLREILSATSPAAVHKLELPVVNDKKVRRQLKDRAQHNSDPMNMMSRVRDLQDKLNEYVRSLQQIRRARLREMVNPREQDDTPDRLRRRLYELEPCRELVARMVLEPPEGFGGGEQLPASLVDGWAPLWSQGCPFLATMAPNLSTSPARLETARRLLEQLVISRRPEDPAALAAYFELERGRTVIAAAAEPDHAAFLTALREYVATRKAGDAEDLRRWLLELRASAKAAGLSEPAIDERLAELDDSHDAWLFADFDRVTRDVGDMQSRLDRLIEDQRRAAESLKDLVSKLPDGDPLVQALRVLGSDALAQQVGVAKRAFRLALDLGQPTAAATRDGDRDRVDVRRAAEDFLAREGRSLEANAPALAPAPAPAASSPASAPARLPGTWESELHKMMELVRHRTGLGFAMPESSAVTAAVQHAAQEDPDAKTERLATLWQTLRAVRLSDEPADFASRFVTLPTQAPDSGAFTKLRSQYDAAVANRAAPEEIRGILEGLLAFWPRGTANFRPAQAEWARLTALLRARAGDFDGACRFVEDALALQLRHQGKSWGQALKQSDDPMIVVSTLFAGYLHARLHRAGEPSGQIGWLIDGRKTGFKEESVREALEGRSVGDLSRLLGIVSALEPEARTDERLLVCLRRLDDLTIAVGSSGLTPVLARELTASRTVNTGVRGLARLIVAHAKESGRWGIALLNEVFAHGRQLEQVDPAERQRWQQLKALLEDFVTATGRRQADLKPRIVELALKFEPLDQNRLKPLAQGIRTALVKMDLAAESPTLVLQLEEDRATIEGDDLVVYLAFTNKGTQLLRNIRLQALPGSEISLDDTPEPECVIESLVPEENVIRKVHVALRVGLDELDDRAQVGLKAEFQTIDERSWSSEKLERELVIRRPDSLTELEPSLAKLDRLFNEDGGEVTREEEDFFGRRDLLDKLDDHLIRAMPPTSLLIVGMRRIGKTSLAKVFLSHARNAEHRTAFIDFKQYADSGLAGESRMPPWRTFGFLATRLLEVEPEGAALRAAMQLPVIGWAEQVYAQFHRSLAPADLLREMIKHLSNSVPDDRLLIITVDELDYFVTPWDSGGDSRQNVYDFFNVLRGMMASSKDPGSRTRWLLSGSDRCAKMFQDYNMPLYGSVKSENVGVATRDDCALILKTPLKKVGIDVSDAALEEVFALTGRVPFFVQILGSRLCKVLRQHPTTNVHRWHVREAVKRSLPNNTAGDTPAPYDRLLEPLTDLPDKPLLQYVFALIANRTSDQEPSIRLDELVGYSEEILGTRLSQLDLMGFAETLKTYEMLEVSSERDQFVYRSRFPLVRMLVKVKYDYAIPVVKEAALRYLDGASTR